LGSDKPIVCTEYNGPGFYEFPDNLKYVPLVMKWSAAIAQQTSDSSGGGVSELYRDPKSLSPQTQLFLMGGDTDLDAKLRRIQCRDLVERNVLALSAGVKRTMFWDLWHDTTQRNDLMTLMYGKLKMFEFADGKFGVQYPIADAFSRMSQCLKGVRSVRPIKLQASPAIMLFEADCGTRGTVVVTWKKGPPFSEEPATTQIEIPWALPNASVVDVFGAKVPVHIQDGRLSLEVGATPIYISKR